jgi:Kef-type K+ transport system membrane component KefB
VLYLAIILIVAKLGGHLAVRLRQPAVLGELMAGIVLGNMDLLGVPVLEPIQWDPNVDMLSRLGVLILLFEVGLESTVAQMMQVGVSSLLVATAGVAAPLLLGFAACGWLLPHASTHLQLFLGATLTATSVGITARVLKDLCQSTTPEARVILGAAVIDDVIGLLILAMVTGMINAAGYGGVLEPLAVLGILLKAAAFLVGALVLGRLISPKLFRLASSLRATGVLLGVGLAFCFSLSWLAGAMGLAPMVGAFAAGLILEDVHYRDFVDRGEHGLEELVQPISSFLVPVFFVLMGMRTDLRSFAEPGALALAAALTVAAILGKQVCGLAARGPGLNRLAIGMGMVPRGEVGLIFASTGLTLQLDGKPLLSSAAFSAVVIMVFVTTLVTPPALTWVLRRQSPAHPREEPDARPPVPPQGNGPA